jgi:hypothetical protein
MDWLWQGLFTNGVWWLLFIAGAAMVAIIRRKWPIIASSVMYGLGALACLSVVYFTFTGRSVFSAPPTSSSNIEAYLKKWITSSGLGVQQVPSPSPNFDFAYNVTTKMGNSILIFRDIKGKPEYLQLQISFMVSPEYQKTLAHLTPEQANNALQETMIEIFRRNAAFTIEGKDQNHIEKITIIRGYEISGITESQLFYAMDDIEATMEIAHSQFALEVGRYDPSHKLPDKKP